LPGCFQNVNQQSEKELPSVAVCVFRNSQLVVSKKVAQRRQLCICNKHSFRKRLQRALIMLLTKGHELEHKHKFMDAREWGTLISFVN